MSPPFKTALIIGPSGRWRDSLGVLVQASGAINTIYYAEDISSGFQHLSEVHALLVLLDAGLPQGEAWRVLEILRTCGHPQVRSIVLAHTYDQEQRAQLAGAGEVLRVGFSGESLYAALHRLMKQNETSSDRSKEANNDDNNGKTRSEETVSPF